MKAASQLSSSELNETLKHVSYEEEEEEKEEEEGNGYSGNVIHIPSVSHTYQIILTYTFFTKSLDATFKCLSGHFGEKLVFCWLDFSCARVCSPSLISLNLYQHDSLKKPSKADVALCCTLGRRMSALLLSCAFTIIPSRLLCVCVCVCVCEGPGGDKGSDSYPRDGPASS